MFPRVMMMLNVVYFVVLMILNELLEKKDIGVSEGINYKFSHYSQEFNKNQDFRNIKIDV
jgi:hypothetical protein